MSDSDQLYRFLFQRLNIRGEVVQLDATWRSVLERADYPPLVRNALGEALAAATLLVATLKIEGSLTLQIRGDGPVHLLVVQADSDNTLRGLARWQGDVPETGNNQDLFGQGQLVLTADPKSGKRYQGIVPLIGDDLQDALRGYFDLSEQLPTQLWLKEKDGKLGGMLIQAMPGDKDDEDGWDRVISLADTVTADELTSLSVEELLHRLFNEEEVRLFDPVDVSFDCSCSREKITQVLLQLGQEETDSILEEQGEISVDCQFCAQNYKFDPVDVAAVFADGKSLQGNKTIQ